MWSVSVTEYWNGPRHWMPLPFQKWETQMYLFNRPMFAFRLKAAYERLIVLYKHWYIVNIRWLSGDWYLREPRFYDRPWRLYRDPQFHNAYLYQATVQIVSQHCLGQFPNFPFICKYPLDFADLLLQVWLTLCTAVVQAHSFVATLSGWLEEWQSHSDSPTLWSRHKYLNNYWMDCCEHSWFLDDEAHWLWGSTWHSWMKCLNSYGMNCHRIWYRHSCSPQDELLLCGVKCYHNHQEWTNLQKWDFCMKK